ncbi:MAG TPA: exonuclease domain-containing protein [Cytophagales bacterium]|nr:exonuclease domain-containing protein [Cytophagales bacterium]
MYAVVDIETTGGNAKEHKIIEIAVIVHDGQRIVDSFQSLVNPKRKIPSFITSLTGIDDHTVAEAPSFEEIAQKVYEITHNMTFVAHNVNFDFSFLKKEFAELNMDFSRKKLCTVRLSRKLLPGLRSYSLGTLCSANNIIIEDRHRAFGDAKATAELLTRLLAKDNATEVFDSFAKTRSQEMRIPPHITLDKFEALPCCQGVYFFHDQTGKVIYVGKAINIKDRVKQHFLGNTHTKNRNMFLNSIHDVSYKITGNELISLLLENEAIKKHYPRYNVTNKTFSLNFGLYKYTDQLGFTRIAVGKVGKHDKPMVAFHTNAEAVNHVLAKVHQHGLCLRLCGVIDSKTKCNYQNPFGTTCAVCAGQGDVDHYNQKVEDAFEGISQQATFLIKTVGRDQEEQGFVMVERGRLLGYGFVGMDATIHEFDALKSYLNPCYDTQDSQSIIKSFLKKAQLVHTEPTKVYWLQG